MRNANRELFRVRGKRKIGGTPNVAVIVTVCAYCENDMTTPNGRGPQRSRMTTPLTTRGRRLRRNSHNKQLLAPAGSPEAATEGDMTMPEPQELQRPIFALGDRWSPKDDEQ